MKPVGSTTRNSNEKGNDKKIKMSNEMLGGLLIIIGLILLAIGVIIIILIVDICSLYPQCILEKIPSSIPIGLSVLLRSRG